MNKPIVLSWALEGKQVSTNVQDCTYYTKGPITLKPDIWGLKSLVSWDHCKCNERHAGVLVHGEFGCLSQWAQMGPVAICS